MTDPNEKQDQVRRYLEGAKHTRSRDERKELQRHVAKHKSKRKGAKSRSKRDWLEEPEEHAESERIARAPAFRPGHASGAHGAAPGFALDEARRQANAAYCGTAITVARGRVTVQLPAGPCDASLPPGSDLEVAVGDLCELEERGDGSLRVFAIAPRRTVLSRPDPNQPQRERVIAANVDRAVIVASVRSPGFRPRLIDRLLVALQRGGVEPIVCANKVDLLEPGARGEITTALRAYTDLGIPALLTSSVSGEGIEELRSELVGRTVVFAGQSGVGKSSLLNALFPKLELRTGATRASDGKGQHTTTASRRIELEDGTAVIDTPGVRSFGLYGIDRGQLRDLFPDLAEHARGCRFSDCSHVEEPDCAVRAAVEAGELHAARYDAYLRILASL